jgi:hypothetical protein
MSGQSQRTWHSGTTRELHPDSTREVPPCPDDVPDDEWERLRRSAVGSLWDATTQVEAVWRWFRLRQASREKPGSAALNGALVAVESALGLNPRGLTAMMSIIAEEKPTAVGEYRKQLSPRRIVDPQTA